MPIMTIQHIFFYVIALLLTACNLVSADDVTPLPTVPPVSATPAAVATQNRTLQLVASPQPSATIASPFVNPIQEALTRYTITADLDYARHTVSVRQTIHYTNYTGADLADIVLNIEPYRWPNVFKLNWIEADNADATYELSERRCRIELPQPLAPGDDLTLELLFQIAIPPIGQGMDSYHGYFGYSSRQLNLGYWLPTVAVYDTNDGWITRQAGYVGEQNVLDVADWDVTINVTGAADSLQIAAPGTMSHEDDFTWNFKLAAGRDFTLSMSEQYNVSQQETESGVIVEVYSFDDALIQADKGAILDAAAASLEAAATSLTMYEDLYGAYRFDRLVVVEGDFPDGMEFSGIVFVSGDWFRRYDGAPSGYLVIITVHETSHQWWYACVGNDAALNPWLDEALATYSEYVFLEEYYPGLKDWWWQWRVRRLDPQGFVDSTVYEFPTIRDYINAVYLRGTLMLHDLRQDLGTDAFFDWLHRYAEAGAGQVVTPDLFWSLLTPAQLEQTQATRARYMRRPNIGEE